jgi:hypothetical protein
VSISWAFSGPLCCPGSFPFPPSICLNHATPTQRGDTPYVECPPAYAVYVRGTAPLPIRTNARHSGVSQSYGRKMWNWAAIIAVDANRAAHKDRTKRKRINEKKIHER